jgi:hypothetical protein
MQNIDTFNELIGWVLAKAYETHPERLTLDPSDMPPWLRKKVSRGPEDFWDRTVLWLEREGFIHVGAKDLGSQLFRKVELTAAGLTALNAVPENVTNKETIGQNLVDELNQTDREIPAPMIGELAGSALGAFTNAHSSSFGGGNALIVSFMRHSFFVYFAAALILALVYAASYFAFKAVVG